MRVDRARYKLKNEVVVAGNLYARNPIHRSTRAASIVPELFSVELGLARRLNMRDSELTYRLR